MKYELNKNHLYDSNHVGSLLSEGRRADASDSEFEGDIASERERVRQEWNETLWERNILDILANKYRKQKTVLLCRWGGTSKVTSSTKLQSHRFFSNTLPRCTFSQDRIG